MVTRTLETLRDVLTFILLEVEYFLRVHSLADNYQQSSYKIYTKATKSPSQGLYVRFH